jgi:hypothetical protein
VHAAGPRAPRDLLPDVTETQDGDGLAIGLVVLGAVA